MNPPELGANAASGDLQATPPLTSSAATPTRGRALSLLNGIFSGEKLAHELVVWPAATWLISELEKLGTLSEAAAFG